MKKRIFIIIITLIPIFCFGQYSESFSKFIPTDSIKAYVDGWQWMGCPYKDYPIKTKKYYPIKIIKQTIDDGQTNTEFKIGPDINFKIGIKNGKFYFPTDKSDKYDIEIDQSYPKNSNPYIYPFNKDYKIVIEKYKFIPDMESVLHLIFIPKKKKKRGELQIREIIIYSNWGLDIEFRDMENTYYTECC